LVTEQFGCLKIQIEILGANEAAPAHSLLCSDNYVGGGGCMSGSSSAQLMLRWLTAGASLAATTLAVVAA
jgi:hypothetical protein